MTDLSQSKQPGCCPAGPPVNSDLFAHIRAAFKKLSTPVWGALLALALILIFAPDDMGKHLLFTVNSLISIAPFLLLSIATAAYLKATGADQIVASAFEGSPVRSIAIASLFGALSPFCSCGVIPLVAALLASGVPFAPVLAFCIASPLMDPEMFILTAAELGTDFALVKTAAAIGLGLFAGYTTLALGKTGMLENGLKDIAIPRCGAPKAEKSDVHWKFWTSPTRKAEFASEGWKSFSFLGRWLAFAFLLEGIMISYIPSENIATFLGNENSYSVLLAAVIGVPAYLNGYAAIPLIGGLMDLGMSPATALTFVLAGGATCIPAAVGIWSLLKPKLFTLYLGFAFFGSVLAGLIYKIILN